MSLEMLLLLALVIVLGLLLINGVGIVWAIVRERHMVNMSNQQTFALSEIERTISDATNAIRSGFDTVTRQIEHSEDLTGEKRQEIIRLILDSERRCMDTMRDLINNLHSQGIHTGVTIQNSTGTGAANQAGHNHHE